MNLQTCLESTPYRSLAAIAAAQELAGCRGLPKNDLISRLSERLSRASWKRRTFQQLDVFEMAVLNHLAANDGRVPRSAMEERFGSIRPFRPWRSDSPQRPWLDPISPAESLHYQGLIFPLTGRERSARLSFVVLPEEFIGLIPNGHSLVATAPNRSPAEKTGCWPLLDMALLLVYLQQNDVAPIHGRWLSPRHCHRVGACLTPPVQTTAARTELQAGRLPFLHYLVEALGLVTVTGNRLRPAPAALSWLGLPPHVQLERLWQCWLSPDDANRGRWQRFRLPGDRLRDPVGFALRLVDVLRNLPAGPWLSQNALSACGAAGLDMLLPWWERDHGQSADDLVAALLCGPLAWLGVTEIDDRHSAALAWRITGAGKRLIAGEPLPPACTPQPLTLDRSLRLELSDHSPLGSLLALADWAELEPGPALRFTPASLSRALAGSLQIDNLLALLLRLVDPAPTAQQRATLLAWSASLAPLHFKSTLLLQTASAAQMAELRNERALRPHLGRQLAPDLVVVSSSKPRCLRRLLARRGQVVVDDALGGLAGPRAASAGLEPGIAYWLAVAARLQSDLADRFAIIPAPPGAVFEQLSAALGPAQTAAVEADVQAALARLEEAIADRPSRLAPTSEEEVVALLQNALDAQSLLQIRYWSPWEAQESRRTIRPLAMEWRGDHRYLNAYCHLVEAERTFRLDRVLEVAPWAGDPGPAAG